MNMYMYIYLNIYIYIYIYVYIYIYIYIYIYMYIYIKQKTLIFSSQIFRKDTHCRRLCKTTEIFVKKKYVFFYLIFIPTYLGFGL